jgi:hypothetical protein
MVNPCDTLNQNVGTLTHGKLEEGQLVTISLTADQLHLICIGEHLYALCNK